MSDYKIKVCGMKEYENIQALISLNPDYIGYIFYPKSKRYVGENPDTTIFSIVPGNIKKVGVFVNTELEAVLDKVNKYGLQMVQLHGGESEDYCKQLKEQGIEIIKTFSIQNVLPVNVMMRYQPLVDYFLFDTRTPRFGGSGEKFDWKILESYALEKPVFLSGGIGPDDAAGIKEMDMPFVQVLDINSRFELEPGYKNVDAVKYFVQEIRQ
ncbi:MAG: phosphoribosylanthranilate isomerase [Bacteroidetes bacterium]|jgi:phosphoribosylanthranilate isomerase|nr:phosphoribosylanthranilate isomerase [Bacteroidota bacterium]